MSSTLETSAPASTSAQDLVSVYGRHVRTLRTASAVIYFGALWSLLLTVAGGRLHSPFLIITRAYAVVNLPVGPSLFHVVVLIVLGYAITTRKRVGWWAFVVLQFLGLITVLGSLTAFTWLSNFSFAERLDLLSILMLAVHIIASLLMLMLAMRVRGVFVGRLLPGSTLGALTILFGGVLITTAVGMVIQRLVIHQPISEHSLRWALSAVLGRHLTSILYGPASYPQEHHWLLFLLGAMSGLVVIAAIVFFMRSQRMPGRTMEDDLRTRELLAKWDEDSLGYFATRDDRSIVMSPDGRAAVSYAVAAGVCVMGSDPLGDPNAWKAAIAAWLKLCATYGWTPAAVSVSERGARALREVGFSVRVMGDEAVIIPDEFDLRTPASRQLAQAVRRVRRAGVNIHIARLAEIEDPLRARLRQVANEYRSGDERGFSMSLDRILSDADARTLVVWAAGEDETIHGLLTFVPWGRRGLSLAHMRRNPEGVNGVVEAMVVDLIARAPQVGCDRISLNFAMFRQVFDQGKAVDASLFDRAAYSLMQVASRFWQLHSLYESNARYRPQWVPRYLCFRGVTELSYVAIAVAMLEGFFPYLGSRTQQRWSPTPSYYEQVHQIEAQAVREVLRGRRYSDQEQVRRDKAQRLREAGREPYPASEAAGITPGEVNQRGETLGAGQASAEVVKVGGRISAIRDHGKLVFLDLTDKGETTQVMARADGLVTPLGELKLLDRGDLVSFTGPLVRTRRGQVSVDASEWTILAKALRPVPKPGDVLDVNTRARERVSHLLAAPDALELLRMRSRAFSSVRTYLGEQGYLEVETPILHPVHGGANARPFVTHINAYSTDVYLRIAPELYLKRLAVAGMEAIYEMGRSFRNEGADNTHNPEFTSLEAYRAGGDYTTMRVLTEALIKQMARTLHGKEVAWRPVGEPGMEGAPTVARVDGVELGEFDLSGPWPVVSVCEAISQAVGRPVGPGTEVEELVEIARAHDVELPVVKDSAYLIGALYDELVEERTIRPTFYVDFPAATSPLTRPHRADPRLAERWDLVAFGMEIGTAYTELTDPTIQRQRFTEQSLAAAAGDPEAMSLDEAFLSDLERGLVPTGGLGLGMDRVCMALLGTSIRQLIAFPFVKPAGGGQV